MKLWDWCDARFGAVSFSAALILPLFILPIFWSVRVRYRMIPESFLNPEHYYYWRITKIMTV